LGFVVGLALVELVAVQLCVHHAAVYADDDSRLRRADGLFGLLGLLLAELGFVPVAGHLECPVESAGVILTAGLILSAFAGAVARPVAAVFAGQDCVVVDLGIDQGERDFGHSGGLALAGAGEDDVLHADAAQTLGGLLAQHPHDGVGDVRLAAAVGADHGGDPVSREMDLRAVAERLEAEHLDLFELEQTTPPGTTARLSQRRDAHLQLHAVPYGLDEPHSFQFSRSRRRHQQYKLYILWIRRFEPHKWAGMVGAGTGYLTESGHVFSIP